MICTNSICRERPPWRSESRDNRIPQAAERHGGRSLQIPRAIGGLIAGLIAGVLLAAGQVACAATAEAVPVEGPAFAAELTGVDAQWRVTLRTADASRTLPADELVRWGSPAEVRQGPLVVLADGGLLAAEIIEADKATLSVDSDLFGLVKLPLESLAGVVFQSPSDRQARDALLDQVAKAAGTTDRIIFANGDQLTGRIDTIKNGTLKLQADIGPASVEVSRVRVLVFNPALWRRIAPQGLWAIVGFRDASRLAVRRLEVDRQSVSLDLVGGLKLRSGQPQDPVLLEPRAGRVAYLSDRKPSGYKQTPFLDLPWPCQADHNVTGGMLRAGGKPYLKGLGVHSEARLTYLLEKPYRRFQAELAIDDSTQGRGSVQFRVLLDEREKLRTEIIRGRMPPLPVSIDLAGVKKLELIVDYADRADELDHADWLAARLVP